MFDHDRGFGISDSTTGAIVAADPDGNIAVKAEIPFVPYGGNLSTAGGLVFSNMVNGDFFAMDDETLEVLWSVNSVRSSKHRRLPTP